MRPTVLAVLWVGVGFLTPRPSSGQEGQPLSTLERARVQRLLEDRVACRGCHVIEGRGGRIGPVLDGIGTRADNAYVRSVITDPTGTIPGTVMPHQPVPEADAARLARYLMSLSPRPQSDLPPGQAPATIDPSRSTDGPALYGRHCAACHGDRGGGDGWNAVNLPVPPTAHADATLMALRADDTLYDGIAVGGWVLDKSPMMPAFAGLLAPSQIRALVGYIRELCECEQPPWARGGI